MIQVKCLRCDQGQQVADEQAGRQVPCVACGELLPVAQSPSTNEPQAGGGPGWRGRLLIRFEQTLSYLEAHRKRLLTALLVVGLVLFLGLGRWQAIQARKARIAASQRSAQAEGERQARVEVVIEEAPPAEPDSEPDPAPPATQTSPEPKTVKRKEPRRARVLEAWRPAKRDFDKGLWRLEPQGRGIKFAKLSAAASAGQRWAYYFGESNVDSEEYVLKLVDVQQKRRGSMLIPELLTGPKAMRFSSDGHWLGFLQMAHVGAAYLGRGGAGKVDPLRSSVLRLLDVEALQEKALIHAPVKSVRGRYAVRGVSAWRFSADSRSLAVAFIERVEVRNLKTLEVELTLRAPHTVRDLVFLADGKVLAGGLADGRVLFWQREDGKLLASVAGPELGELEVLGGGRVLVMRREFEATHGGNWLTGWRLDKRGLPSEELWKKEVRALSPDGKRYVCFEKVTVEGKPTKIVMFYDAEAAYRWVDGFAWPDRLGMWPRNGPRSQMGFAAGGRYLISSAGFGQPLAIDLEEKAAYALGEPAVPPSPSQRRRDTNAFAQATNRVRNPHWIEGMNVGGRDVLAMRFGGEVDLYRVPDCVEHLKAHPPEPIKLTGEERQWKDDEKRKIQAKLVGYEDGVVQLRSAKTRRDFPLPVQRLSVDDRKHLLWTLAGGRQFSASLVNGASQVVVFEKEGRGRFKLPHYQLVRTDRYHINWLGNRIQSQFARRVEKLQENDRALLNRMRSAEDDLQGVWRFTSDGEGPPNDARVFIIGNRIWTSFRVRGQATQWPGTRLSVDPSGKPGILDRHQDNGAILRGIFERKGNSLRWQETFLRGRYTEFDKTAMELERIKPVAKLEDIGLPEEVLGGGEPLP